MRAHSPNHLGQWHDLGDHLRATAELCRTFASSFGFGDLGHLLGMMHDVGKASHEFQKYIRDSAEGSWFGPSPDHKLLSARCLHELRKGVPVVIPMLIAGHHGGLMDPETLIRRIKTGEAIPQPVIKVAESVAPDEATIQNIKQLLSNYADNRNAFELLIRMLFSCLVDADYTDTAEHSMRYAPSPCTPGLPVLLDLFCKDQERLLSEKQDSTIVNRVRREVYEDCVRAAGHSPGVFKLTVPTGGGKTRSSLAFALRHAVAHNLERIIYAIPYTSVIEQTARVFRGIFNHPLAVLEHHSLAAEPEDQDELGWYMWATENWDAPLIVTTTVQLFESLFSNKPGRCRKLHRIVNSVIILDEVQCLPVHLLGPILSVLRSLVADYNVTVVLCTATQPALDEQSRYLEGLPDAREIAGDVDRYFESLRRCDYEVELQPTEHGEIARRMRQHRQALAVVNSRRDALRLLDELGRDAYHLSSLMCPLHRVKVLGEIQERLRSGRPCHVVSTQVIECGVDADFPVVFRALAPLDRIIQAAGRCNREGKRASGNVLVFDLKDGSLPRGSYRVGYDRAGALLRQGRRVDDLDLLREYFHDIYRLCDVDSYRIEERRARFEFPTVAKSFRLIEDDTVSVLVPYEEALDTYKEVIAAVAAGKMNRQLWRSAQPLMVSIYRSDVERLGHNLRVLKDEELYAWQGDYDNVRGIPILDRDPTDLQEEIE